MTDDRQLVRFGKWSPLGFAWVASLLGLLLIAILTCLLMKHRRHNRPPIKVGLVYHSFIHSFIQPMTPNIKPHLCIFKPVSKWSLKACHVVLMFTMCCHADSFLVC